MTIEVLVFLIAGLAILGAETVGVIRRGEHRVDTLSEVWWSLRDRLGPWSAAIALPLALFLGWLWAHLTFEGRKRKS